MDETLINFGGGIKSVEETETGYKFGGWLVVFDKPDVSNLRDRFTKSTDFDIEDGDRRSVYYNHGLDGTIKKEKIGDCRVTIKDAGVWITGELKKRRDYLAKHIDHIAENIKEFGLSSGAPAHLVERVKVAGGHEIKKWVLSEASITPTPAEPMTGMLSLKSLIELEESDELKDVLDSGSYAPEIKPSPKVVTMRDKFRSGEMDDVCPDCGGEIEEGKCEACGYEVEKKSIKEWDESAHPRAKDGKFGSGGGNDKASFSVRRMNRVTGEFEDETFSKGDRVKVFISKDNQPYGELVGISHANGEARVRLEGSVRDGTLTFSFGEIGKAEPRSVEEDKGATAGEILARANARGASDDEWTDADAVPLSMQSYTYPQQPKRKSRKSDDDWDFGAEVKKYDPRQPRDDHGKWSSGPGGSLSVGHAIHVMRSEGIHDEAHHESVRNGIESGRLKTREDVLAVIDAHHDVAAGRATSHHQAFRQRLAENAQAKGPGRTKLTEMGADFEYSNRVSDEDKAKHAESKRGVLALTNKLQTAPESELPALHAEIDAAAEKHRALGESIREKLRTQATAPTEKQGASTPSGETSEQTADRIGKSAAGKEHYARFSGEGAPVSADTKKKIAAVMKDDGAYGGNADFEHHAAHFPEVPIEKASALIKEMAKKGGRSKPSTADVRNAYIVLKGVASKEEIYHALPAIYGNARKSIFDTQDASGSAMAWYNAASRDAICDVRDLISDRMQEAFETDTPEFKTLEELSEGLRGDSSFSEFPAKVRGAVAGAVKHIEEMTDARCVKSNRRWSETVHGELLTLRDELKSATETIEALADAHAPRSKEVEQAILDAILLETRLTLQDSAVLTF